MRCGHWISRRQQALRLSKPHQRRSGRPGDGLLGGSDSPPHSKSWRILEKYSKVLPDGTQAWAQVRNGQITNGGLDVTPR